jgi:hypothetical protein
MSKRALLLVGLLIVLLAGGIGFGIWFVRNRASTSNPSAQSSSSSNGAISNSNVGSSALGGDSGSIVALPSNVTTSTGTHQVTTPSSATPQLLIVAGDAPQAPVYQYQGRTMTKQEFEKAWNTSSTKKESVTSVSPQADPNTDKDHDGLTYEEEMNLGTDPNNADTDGDGLTDGQEVKVYKTNPKNFDTDGDGLTDGDEVKTYKTDPLKSDTDGDGFLDGQEVQSGYNPLGPGKLK